MQGVHQSARLEKAIPAITRRISHIMTRHEVGRFAEQNIKKKLKLSSSPKEQSTLFSLFLDPTYRSLFQHQIGCHMASAGE